MAKTPRKNPEPHLVFVDTSTLWIEDKHHVVDPQFEEFWDTYHADFAFELKVPEVVRGEVLFQQTAPALKSLRNANDAMQQVGRISRKSYSHRVTEGRVRREIREKVDRWLDGKHAVVFPTPVNAIQWADVIDQAIWRKPPFSPEKDEKGFRDALILETIVEYCDQELRNHPIILLCKDRLLRETAEKRLTHDDRFTAYEFIGDFRSYLDLTKEELEDAFIKSIIRRARKKFFSQGDPDCLYNRDNIRQGLQTKYQKYFDNPEESESPPVGLLFTQFGQVLRLWEPTTQGKFQVSRPQFVSVTNDNEYEWLNVVTFVREYKQIETPGLLANPLLFSEHVLILPFHITWRARVTRDGRFRRYWYVSDELKDNVFRFPTGEDRQRMEPRTT